MLVFAISSGQYSPNTNPQYLYLNSRGGETETTPDIYTPDNSENTECGDCKLYYNVNLWKQFCHKQIAAGNFDIVA